MKYFMLYAVSISLVMMGCSSSSKKSDRNSTGTTATTETTSGETETTETTTTATSGIKKQAITTAEVPTCDANELQSLVYDTDKAEFQHCTSSGWATVALVSDSIKGTIDGTTKIGTTTATDVSSTVTKVTAATEANTASTIVSRDASGNFSAGTITATAFSGNGSSLTNLMTEEVCGRLTLDENTPITTADQTSKTTLYFVPFRCGRIPLYDGTNWSYKALSAVNVTVPNTTNTNFDVFIYHDGTNLVLETVDWANNTTRNNAISRQDGVLIKTGEANKRYLGTGRTTGVAGNTEDSAARRLLWNYYHRVPKQLVRQESTASWTYNGVADTWRYANNSGTNIVEFVRGVDEDMMTGFVSCDSNNSGSNSYMGVGIGLDTGTANSAYFSGSRSGGSGGGDTHQRLIAKYRGFPGIGYHFFSWIEIVQNTTNNTFYGNRTTPNWVTAGLVVDGQF